LFLEGLLDLLGAEHVGEGEAVGLEKGVLDQIRALAKLGACLVRHHRPSLMSQQRLERL
jgi:hypothetical protein